MATKIVIVCFNKRGIKQDNKQ